MFQIPMTHEGKISKSGLLVEIIKDEMKNNRPIDKQKILLIAQKQIEQKDQLATLTKKDWDNAQSKLRNLGIKIQLDSTSKPIPTNKEQFQQTTNNDTISVEELLQAIKLLRLTGFSLQRSIVVLQTVAEALGKEKP